MISHLHTILLSRPCALACKTYNYLPINLDRYFHNKFLVPLQQCARRCTSASTQVFGAVARNFVKLCLELFSFSFDIFFFNFNSVLFCFYQKYKKFKAFFFLF